MKIDNIVGVKLHKFVIIIQYIRHVFDLFSVHYSNFFLITYISLISNNYTTIIFANQPNSKKNNQL